MPSVAEEVQQVLAENRRDRERWIAFHADWLRKNHVIEARSAGKK